MTNDTTNAKLQFVSDDASPISPAAWEALERANSGPESTFAVPYGVDPITAKSRQPALFRRRQRRWNGN